MLKTDELTDKIIETLQDNKAHKIVKIDLRNIENCFCSVFVICHGTSGTHIAGMSEAVEENVKQTLGDTPFHMENSNTTGWTVLDYGDVIVHIFDKELRDYYQLEEFWGDGISEEIPDESDPV